MPSAVMSYVYLFATVALTVYGQLVFKWQIDEFGSFPSSGGERWDYLLRFFTNPWVISVFVASLAAALTYLAALTRLELSHAYPFMSLSFVLVLIFSVLFLSEGLTVPKLIGVLLVAAGLIVGSRF